MNELMNEVISTLFQVGFMALVPFLFSCSERIRAQGFCSM